jgi:murein DD-endopeptidase MepM/ murein hydrolase activator NlpD
MTADSFEEKLSIKLSKLNIFAFGGFMVFLCFFSAVLLITTTPLAEYVPGKATSKVQQELISLTIKSDALIKTLESQNNYLQNIRNIISGDELSAPKIIEPKEKTGGEVFFEKSIEDSLLRVDVESEDKGMIKINNDNSNELIMFFSPISGMITDRFNAKNKHFGIDLVAREKTRISSVLGGTIVISQWTSETGYVIGVQHKNDYLSLYKHNSVLLKTVGDFVNAGDPISIIGNSGELSSGPHLHFELWHQGIPVNPEDYILF